MDGLEISEIDQIDQNVFDGSGSDSDECEEMPLPDCIGIDSAVQDEEEQRLKNDAQQERSIGKTRTVEERDLELKVLKHDSIRRQILENTIGNGHNNKGSSASSSAAARPRFHVMNITEKAGMSGIDKDKINQVIHDASKGSLFYQRQAQRQAEIHKSIEKMLNRVKAATPKQVEDAKVTCDKIVDELEKQRVFNRIIVHFDLDMFFAAVEIRDNPDLKDKPVAVGGDSMVSTSNYVARKFGVRAAMPGFIAKKLCPELILIKPNGFKYREASSEVFAILEKYDPELTGMSLDEAYLDLTEYVKGILERDDVECQEYYDGTLPKVWWTKAVDVVEEIRQAIFDKTQLTCSAGIACNALLAKISTDINKPDGQFMVQGYRKDVIDFISKTAVEKVSGIGKVSAQFLNALEIKTCGDIYNKRHFLPLVFYEINVKFYLRVALGDGSTSIKSDEQRKSKSVERTFSAIKDPLILLDKLDSICEELCSKYLKPYRIRGRTVTVKLKRNTFMTTTRSYSMLVPTNDKLVVYSAAKNLLMTEIANEPASISYRLLGVKLSNLADDGVMTNQLTIDAMLRNQELSKSETRPADANECSQQEALQSTVNETDLQCPYCFKSYVDFGDLESHVDSCKAKTPLDVNRFIVSQKVQAKPSPATNTFLSQFKNDSPKFEACRASCRGAKQAAKIKRQPRRISPAATPSPRGQGSQDPCASARKPSFYERFIESNSQRLKQSVVVDPFQCPYCLHGFIGFSSLESHVVMCTKRAGPEGE